MWFLGAKHFAKPKAYLSAYKAKQFENYEFGSLYCKSNIKNKFSLPVAPNKITCKLTNSHLVQNLKVTKKNIKGSSAPAKA